MKIDRLGPKDVDRLVAAGGLFDGPTTAEWATRFLTSAGHHALLASIDGNDIGFVTGVEMTHPDKGTEMFVYELGIAEPARRRGIGKALITALQEVAMQQGCYGMWVATEADNAAALGTYRSAGAEDPTPGVTITWTFPNT